MSADGAAPKPDTCPRCGAPLMLHTHNLWKQRASDSFWSALLAILFIVAASAIESAVHSKLLAVGITLALAAVIALPFAIARWQKMEWICTRCPWVGVRPRYSDE